MAMQKFYVIKDTNCKQITAISYNPLKHEVVAGCEDGTIKAWECVGDHVGRLTRVCHEHNGWINCFLYLSDMKLLLSAANDGKIISWGSNMLPTSITKIGSPTYCMAWNVRRNQIIFGLNAALKVYHLKDPMKDGKLISNKAFVATDHTDLVKGVVCHETRVFSVGYDRKLCIYDSFSYPGKFGLKLVTCLYPAHDAGITTIVVARDNENNTWLFTGGFDKTVKVWSQDGQIMHKFDGFSTTVSSICYVVPAKTIWIAAGMADTPMYDPKSGDNVSEFIGTFQEKDQDTESQSLSLLQFIPDLNQLIATDSRRQILMWKYNPTGCITALKHRNAVECLTYTKKVPLLIFSGDSAGQIMKWERLQSNTFMYSKENLPRSEAVAQLAAQIAEKYDWAATDKSKIREQLLCKGNNPNNVQANIAAMKLLFVEELDLLLVASEDSSIYVWGFDHDAVNILQQMKPSEEQLSNKFAFLLQKNTDRNDNYVTDIKTDCDSVTNRVAGFVCKTVFAEHTQCVTGLAVVGRSAGYDTTYLISSGWDRRILLWDLERMRLHDSFRNMDSKHGFENEELAADGIIFDLVYCAQRNEFAYASCDKLVYIRQFAERGSDMKLKAVLQGHEAEVTQIRWNVVHQKWISGSEDGTIRIWSADGLSCDLVLSAYGSVTALCVDMVNGCVVAGVQDVIRVYDIEAKIIVQTNIGHLDAVRYLIHIPERQQYVSASWDCTVRLWNAYKTVTKRRASMADNKEKQSVQTQSEEIEASA